MSEHKHHLAAGQQVTAERPHAPWPRFRCHKVVSAMKIGHVEGHKVWPADGELEPVNCRPEMFARGKPVEGDYLVEYEGDGYRSFSPGMVFEAGYSALTGMDFGDAIRALKAGKRVARAGWNGKGMWIVLLHLRAEPSDPAVAGIAIRPLSPCFGIKTAGGDMQPGWLASQPDMLATDWSIVEG